jgi:hypothetical protein
VFPNCDDILLGHTSAADAFDIVDRYVAHHLSSHVANSAVPADKVSKELQ